MSDEFDISKCWWPAQWQPVDTMALIYRGSYRDAFNREIFEFTDGTSFYFETLCFDYLPLLT